MGFGEQNQVNESLDFKVSPALITLPFLSHGIVSCSCVSPQDPALLILYSFTTRLLHQL